MDNSVANIKRESAVIALLKFAIPLILAVLLFIGANWYRNLFGDDDGRKYVSPVPAAVPKPVFTPREFPNLEPQEQEFSGYLLEYSEPVGDEYFADAVFAGDSLTDGFRIYDVGQHFQVISYVGLSPSTAITQPVFKTPEGDMLTMADAIKYMGARKAYILLGTNGLNWTTPEKLISGYDELVDVLLATNPDTYIILESILPVTAATAAARPSYTRENVEYYNELVRQLAVEKGVYFLDVYSAFVGENGYLPTNIAASDGMHLTPNGYRVWFEYITTHTIKGNAAFAMDDKGRIIPMKPAQPVEETENEEQEEAESE